MNHDNGNSDDLLSHCLRLVNEGGHEPEEGDGEEEEEEDRDPNEYVNIPTQSQQIDLQQQQQQLVPVMLPPVFQPPAPVMLPMPAGVVIQPLVQQQQLFCAPPPIIHQPQPTTQPLAEAPNATTFDCRYVPIAPAPGSAVIPPPQAASASRQNANSGSGPPKCPECDKEFSTRQALRLHSEEIHGGGRGCFSCGECGRVFSRLRSVERHHVMAHGGSPGGPGGSGGQLPRCDKCGKRVVNVALHFRKFHCKSVAVQASDGRKRGRRKLKNVP